MKYLVLIITNIPQPVRFRLKNTKKACADARINAAKAAAGAETNSAMSRLQSMDFEDEIETLESEAEVYEEMQGQNVEVDDLLEQAKSKNTNVDEGFDAL